MTLKCPLNNFFGWPYILSIAIIIDTFQFSNSCGSHHECKSRIPGHNLISLVMASFACPCMPIGDNCLWDGYMRLDQSRMIAILPTKQSERCKASSAERAVRIISFLFNVQRRLLIGLFCLTTCNTNSTLSMYLNVKMNMKSKNKRKNSFEVFLHLWMAVCILVLIVRFTVYLCQW